MNPPYIAAIESVLNALRGRANYDFAALAWISQDDHRIRWICASGNRSERYKRIVLKQGEGLTGVVFRIGRTVLLQSESHETNPADREYPILLAEQLQSAAAYPVRVASLTRGVLLVGNRANQGDLRVNPEAMEQAIGEIAACMAVEPA